MRDAIDRAATILNAAIVAEVNAERVDIETYEPGIEFERRLAQALHRAGLLTTSEGRDE